ncbi:MAG: hypothetical protein CMH64_03570 [Nanoarchaeota archaeon]|nr:hypothetical protein [Nanoarchaeota archaeon]|tara:strand:+ start:5200 stop:5556 length:357 start_codon:yes stop_codon:yes gene_type:complete
MTTLIACLSTGKGTWGHVSQLLKDESFEKIILVTNEFGKENFTKNDRTELVVIDPNQNIKELQNDIQTKLKELIKDLEVSLNIVSGSGKEHMALLSALLKLGLGINLVAVNKEGVGEV